MNQYFVQGFEKKALLVPVMKGVANLAKGALGYAAKNPLKTLGATLTAAELGSGAANGARMATAKAPRTFSVSPVQY
jgi:hypothetical protein